MKPTDTTLTHKPSEYTLEDYIIASVELSTEIM